jgi:two-component system, OmpR family, response regulator
MRVLLVEDDLMIGQTLQSALQEASYATDWVRDGQVALDAVYNQQYDLILLDLGLPKKDGFEVLKFIRNKNNQTPVVIMTARDAIEDRVIGLDNGADDYVLKPFELAELLARMRAVIRRKGGAASPLLSNGYLALDPSTFQVKRNDQENIQLTNREFGLLQALMIRPGAILSRTELEERIYGWGDEVESNAIEFLIFSLRKKLGADAIKNVRGVGWLVSKQS